MNDFLQNFSEIYVLAYNDNIRKFDAKNKLITNVSNPEHDYDVVNLFSLKNYIFKNIQSELDIMKNDIIRIYSLLNFTDINNLYFSKLDINDDLKEKIINFKQTLNSLNLSVYEFTTKYTEIEKKLTNIQFKNIILENQIEELQNNIDKIYNKNNIDLLSNNNENNTNNHINQLYYNFIEEFNIYKNNNKLTIEKLNIDINLINDKIAEYFNNSIINKNLESLKIQVNDNLQSIKTIKNDINKLSDYMFNNCLYYIKIIPKNNTSKIEITNFNDSLIQDFINSPVYENVELFKIKYLWEFFDYNNKKIDNINFNTPLNLIIENALVIVINPITKIKQKISSNSHFLKKIYLTNNIDTKKINYAFLSLNLIFRIQI